jgi:E3 ubiquitin-protein ligase RGLG
LGAYKKAAGNVVMSGPTSYAPCIEKAVSIAKQSRGYHIALIITDGCTLQLKRDLEALRRASEYPVSFIIVGVGDGPWEKAEKLDDDNQRKFDNLNFVSHAEFCGRGERKNDIFILEALKELPEQFRMITDLDLLD